MRAARHGEGPAAGPCCVRWAAAGPGGVSARLPRLCRRRGRRQPSCSRRSRLCVRRRKDGRAVRGRRLRLVTPECATEERGAPPRPGRACSPPPPASRRRPAHFLPGPPLRVGNSRLPCHLGDRRGATYRAESQGAVWAPRPIWRERRRRPPAATATFVPAAASCTRSGKPPPDRRPCCGRRLRARRWDGVRGSAAREKRAAPRTGPGPAPAPASWI